MHGEQMPQVTLNTGARIPQLGFGVFAIDDTATAQSVKTALESGYRSIDTAAAYLNERGVGSGIRQSGIDRSELFVTTKLWNEHHLVATSEFENSLERLGLDYVDLYLIHWPVSVAGTYLRAWDALEQILQSGRARAIGVSNFSEQQLTEIIALGGSVPSVNQVEIHPLHGQAALRAFHSAHGIATQAWSPLGRGLAFGLPEIQAIARTYSVSEAQVVLRWHLQLGTIPLPKSASDARIRENIDLFGFELTAEELSTIGALDRHERVEDSYYEWA
jgi:2,5-diketo-D-gluconate reductase A